MDMVRGELRCLYAFVASGAGGNISLPIQPDIGEAWDIMSIRVTHNDAVRLVRWNVHDEIEAQTNIMFSLAAAPVTRYFYTDCAGFIRPFRIYHTCHMHYEVDAMAAGMTVEAFIIVERIRGLVPEGA